MQAQLLAQRLLEADEDFDVQSELKRYTTTPHPGIEIESAYNHWDVYRTTPAGRTQLGSIYYDDMEDAPVDQMTPEARQFHEAHRWTAVPMTSQEPSVHASFDQALSALVPKIKENEEDDLDIEGTIERTASAAVQPVSMEIVNANNRQFRVVLIWDQEPGGRAYDAKGRIVRPEIQPMVEFYDLTHADDPKYPTIKGKGQFVSRYYAATLMERPTGGLNLYGGEPVWQIDNQAMVQVRAWIKQEVEKRGYRLKDDLFGMKYEALDPDDPTRYLQSLSRPQLSAQASPHAPEWKKLRDAKGVIRGFFMFQPEVNKWYFALAQGNRMLTFDSEAELMDWAYQKYSPLTLEALDPDDPELYTNPERFNQQPKYEQMESELRVMLGKIYDTVHIHRTPSRWANVFKGLEDYWKWTIHCKREMPLRLPNTRPYPGHRGPDPNSWRLQAEKWFESWAQQAGVSLREFKIYGRLRKDPVFQFETHLPWKHGHGLLTGQPIKEDEDEPTPEQIFGHYVATHEWERDLYQDLWKFHPYGIGYEVLDLNQRAYVVARTMFNPTKDGFIQRFGEFVRSWFEAKRIFPVKFVKLYTFQHANKPAGYEEHSVIAAVNIPWPDIKLPEYAAIEVGEA